MEKKKIGGGREIELLKSGNRGFGGSVEWWLRTWVLNFPHNAYVTSSKSVHLLEPATSGGAVA